jgi:hypothetical protein
MTPMGRGKGVIHRESLSHSLGIFLQYTVKTTCCFFILRSLKILLWFNLISVYIGFFRMWACWSFNSLLALFVHSVAMEALSQYQSQQYVFVCQSICLLFVSVCYLSLSAICLCLLLALCCRLCVTVFVCFCLPDIFCYFLLLAPIQEKGRHVRNLALSSNTG